MLLRWLLKTDFLNMLKLHYLRFEKNDTYSSHLFIHLLIKLINDKPLLKEK